MTELSRSELKREVRVVPLDDQHRSWIAARTIELFGGETVVSRGQVHRPCELDGLVALASLDDSMQEQPVGLLTYRLEGKKCELVTIDAFLKFQGIGTNLLDRFEERMKVEGVNLIWLVTTNDNVEALRFYQKRGFHMAELHPGAVEHSRQLKPTIPLKGNFDISIRDEIVLTREL